MRQMISKRHPPKPGSWPGKRCWKDWFWWKHTLKILLINHHFIRSAWINQIDNFFSQEKNFLIYFLAFAFFFHFLFSLSKKKRNPTYPAKYSSSIPMGVLPPFWPKFPLSERFMAAGAQFSSTNPEGLAQLRPGEKSKNTQTNAFNIFFEIFEIQCWVVKGHQ